MPWAGNYLSHDTCYDLEAHEVATHEDGSPAPYGTADDDMYSRCVSLALANRYSIDTARLLPFSVDGLIIASSMALMTGTRPALARTGLVLSILATVAANIMFGVRFGVTGAVVSSWPAVSFTRT